MTLWTVARQAPLSMGFSRQEYWNGLLFPSPGDLPDPGIELGSPALQADSLLSEPPGKPFEDRDTYLLCASESPGMTSGACSRGKKIELINLLTNSIMKHIWVLDLAIICRGDKIRH